jgi:hypothetical protein
MVAGHRMLGVYVAEDNAFYVAPIGSQYSATGHPGPAWVPIDDAVATLRSAERRP